MTMCPSGSLQIDPKDLALAGPYLLSEVLQCTSSFALKTGSNHRTGQKVCAKVVSKATLRENLLLFRKDLGVLSPPGPRPPRDLDRPNDLATSGQPCRSSAEMSSRSDMVSPLMSSPTSRSARRVSFCGVRPPSPSADEITQLQKVVERELVLLRCLDSPLIPKILDVVDTELFIVIVFEHISVVKEARDGKSPSRKNSGSSSNSNSWVRLSSLLKTREREMEATEEAAGGPLPAAASSATTMGLSISSSANPSLHSSSNGTIIGDSSNGVGPLSSLRPPSGSSNSPPSSSTLMARPQAGGTTMLLNVPSPSLRDGFRQQHSAAMVSQPQARRPSTHFSAYWQFRLVYQLVSALECCHAAGIAHGQLSPDNIVVDEKTSGIIKVMNFGMNHLLISEDRCSSQQSQSEKSASSFYTAPELCPPPSPDFVRAITLQDLPSVDMWHLGVLLYWMGAGRSPFANIPGNQLQNVICDGAIELSPRFDPLMSDVVKQLLHPDPRQRLSLSQLKDHPWWVRSCAVDGFDPHGLTLIGGAVCSPIPLPVADHPHLHLPSTIRPAIGRSPRHNNSNHTVARGASSSFHSLLSPSPRENDSDDDFDEEADKSSSATSFSLREVGEMGDPNCNEQRSGEARRPLANPNRPSAGGYLQPQPQLQPAPQRNGSGAPAPLPSVLEDDVLKVMLGFGFQESRDTLMLEIRTEKRQNALRGIYQLLSNQKRIHGSLDFLNGQEIKIFVTPSVLPNPPAAKSSTKPTELPDEKLVTPIHNPLHRPKAAVQGSDPSICTPSSSDLPATDSQPFPGRQRSDVQLLAAEKSMKKGIGHLTEQGPNNEGGAPTPRNQGFWKRLFCCFRRGPLR